MNISDLSAFRISVLKEKTPALSETCVLKMGVSCVNVVLSLPLVVH